MMQAFSLVELAKALEGELHGADARVWSVSTDSRRALSGDLFVALRGEHFDGHEFVLDVAGKGACGALVDHEVDVDLHSRFGLRLPQASLLLEQEHAEPVESGVLHATHRAAVA